MKAAICLVVVAGVCAVSARAQEASERERLTTERAAIESRHAERAQACQQDFFVTACLDAAQKDRRSALDRVRIQRQALDDAERQRRAADRMRRIHEKVGAQSAAAAAPPRALREPKPRMVAEPASAAASATAVTQAELTPPQATVKQAERTTAQSAGADRARLKQAAEHRAALEKRRAERAAKQQRAAPLPVPPASAIGTTR